MLFRAFGDKSGPPTLPEAVGEPLDAIDGKCVADEQEEGEEEEEVEEEGEQSAVQEQTASELVKDQVCPAVAEQAEGEVEKGNEEGDEAQEDQRSPQGTGFRPSSHKHVNILCTLSFTCIRKYV